MNKQIKIIEKAKNKFRKRKLSSAVSNLTLRELFLLEKELGLKISFDDE